MKGFYKLMAEQDKNNQDQVKQYTLGGSGTGKRQAKRRPGRGKRGNKQEGTSDRSRAGKRSKQAKFALDKQGGSGQTPGQEAVEAKQDPSKTKPEIGQIEDNRPGKRGARRQGKAKNYKEKVAQVTKNPQTIADLRQDNIRLEKEIVLDIKSIQQIDLD